MGWPRSLSTHIWIFNVGRGNAAFIRSGLNQGFIVDTGGGEEFDPASFIHETFVTKLDPYKENKIAQVTLSHPHSDHISQCERLKSKDPKGASLYPTLLTCPNDKDYKGGTESKEKINWNRIKNPKGTEKLLDTYKDLFSDRQLPLQTIQFDSKRTIPNLEYGIYYIRPPVCEKIHEKNDQAYGNCTSIMFYFRHGQHTILFPADMTPEGMKHVLEEKNGVEKRYTRFDRKLSEEHPDWREKTSDQPSLKSLLKSMGLSILVAPHHGLESGFSLDLYAAISGGRPQLVVLSERLHKRETDGSIHSRYYSEKGASGLTVEIEGKKETRRSLSTIKGHHILIVFEGTGPPKVYADKSPEKLLEKLGR